MSSSSSSKTTAAVAILTVMLLTFVTASSYPYVNNPSNINYTKGLYGYGQEQQPQQQVFSPANQSQQQQAGTPSLDQMQVFKAKPDKGNDKGKPDKGNDKDKGGKDKKPKRVQNVKISGDVDVSQVTNATDAAQAYSFVVTSGSFTSKAKSLEGDMTDATEALTLHFNGKLAVNAGDAFTITGVSSTDAYNTVSGTGTFVEQPQGKSGKTTVVGTLDGPLVLQETAVEDLS